MEILALSGGLFVASCGGMCVDLNVRKFTKSNELGFAAGVFTACVAWPLFTMMFLSLWS